MAVELTVVLRTVIAGAGTKSKITLLFGVNHCTGITLLVQRLLKRCSVVKLLNSSVRELALKISCNEGNRGKGRMKREMQNKASVLWFLYPNMAWEPWSVGALAHSSGVGSVSIPLFGELLQKRWSGKCLCVRVYGSWVELRSSRWRSSVRTLLCSPAAGDQPLPSKPLFLSVFKGLILH